MRHVARVLLTWRESSPANRAIAVLLHRASVMHGVYLHIRRWLTVVLLHCSSSPNPKEGHRAVTITRAA